MDDNVYPYAAPSDPSTYLGFPREGTSYHLAIDSRTTPASGTGTLLHQVQPFPGAARMDPCMAHWHPTVYADAPQINTQVYPAGSYTPTWSTLIWGSNEEAVMQRNGNLALYGVVPPVIRPSSSIRRSSRAPHLSLNLTLSGSSGPELIITKETNGELIYAEHTHARTNTSWRDDELLVNVPSGQGHQYNPPIAQFPSFRSQSASGTDCSHPFPEAMPPVQASLTSVDPTEPHFSTPLALPGIPSTSPVTHCRDQKASRDQQQQSRKLSKELATVSSARHPRSSNRRSAGTRKDSKSSSLCEICDKRFAQPQGLNRHRREKHAGKLARCIFCGVFEWNRLYILKEHLTRGHPELPVDIVTALIEATKARRRVIFTSRHSTR